MVMKMSMIVKQNSLKMIAKAACPLALADIALAALDAEQKLI